MVVAGRAEALHAHRVGWNTAGQEQRGGVVGEAGGPADVRDPIAARVVGEIIGGEVSRWPSIVSGGTAGVDDVGLGSRELVGVVEVVGGADRDGEADQVGATGVARVPEHCHARHDARAAGDEQGRCCAVPDEPFSDRAAHFEGVAWFHDIVEEDGHLAVGQAFDGEFDATVAAGEDRSYSVMPAPMPAVTS